MKAATRRVICEWASPVNPFFGSEAARLAGNESRPAWRPTPPVTRRKLVRSSDQHQTWLPSGCLNLHGLENSVEGDCTATHIQAVGQMRVAVQRGHTMLGKGKNMRQGRVVQRF